MSAAAQLDREQLDLFFELSKDLLCIATTDGYFKKVNASFANALGVDRMEMLRRPFADFIHPEDREKTARECEVIERDGRGSLRFANRYVRRDGAFLWLAWNCTFEGGYIYAIARDITAEREANQALAEARQKLDFLLSSLPLTLLVIDARGHVDLSVGRGLEFRGLSADKVHGRPFVDLYEDEGLSAGLRQALGGDRAFVRSTHSGATYETHFEPMSGPDGRVASVIASSILRTDEQKLADDLFHKQMANSMPQIIWTARPDGAIEYYNDRWYEFFGLERGQFADEGREQALHPDDLDRWQATWARAVARAEPYEIEYRFIDPRTRGSRWFLGRAVPIKARDGSVIRWCGSSRDIHEQKLLLEEKKVLLARESRALKASERAREKLKTALREHSQLRDQQRAAALASELKSRFLANMSHEIRTPLNGILGLSSLLQQTPLSDRQAEYVDLIIQSADHLAAIVEDILDLSKIESNQMDLERGVVDVPALVNNVIDLLQPLALEKSIQLRARIIPENSIEILGDGLRLKQILLNLVQNAVKFTASGSVFVAVESIREGSNAPILRFAVKDTGIGISAAARERIFDPFVQADTSTTREFGGTGLGLSICKKLVELMGGRIGVESMPGEGSTFYFEIPGPNLEIPFLETKIRGRSTPAAGLRKSERPCQILVAEDNGINKKVIDRMLEAMGHRAVVVENGQQVLEKLEERDFDLVLMDCHMPTLDGFATTRALRSGEGRGRSIPILALTADAFAESRTKCAAAGMNGFVAKPIDPSALFDQIERVIGQAEIVGEVQSFAAVAAKAKPLLEINTLKELEALGPDRGFATELVGDFLASYPRRLSLLRESIDQGELRRTFEVAHTLKSVAGAIGALHIQEAAAALEASAQRDSPGEVRRDFDRVAASIRASAPVLIEFQRGDG